MIDNLTEFHCLNLWGTQKHDHVCLFFLIIVLKSSKKATFPSSKSLHQRQDYGSSEFKNNKNNNNNWEMLKCIISTLFPHLFYYDLSPVVTVNQELPINQSYLDRSSPTSYLFSGSIIVKFLCAILERQKLKQKPG